MKSPAPRRNSIFVNMLYIFAGLVFLVALWIGLSLIISTPHALFPVRILFQSPAFDVLWNRIIRLATGIGVVLILTGALLAGALAALGRLVLRNQQLAARVAELETEVSALAEQAVLQERS